MSLADRFTSNRIMEPSDDSVPARQAPARPEQKPARRSAAEQDATSGSALSRLKTEKRPEKKKQIPELETPSKPAKKKRVKAEKKIPAEQPAAQASQTPNYSGNQFAQHVQKGALPEDDDAELLREAVRERRYNAVSRFFTGLLIGACVYIVFLIYGVVVTNYQYNDEGRVAPQVMSVNDIKEAKDFEIIVGQYQKCRLLYEMTLMLDYRLAQGVEEEMTLAPEYEELLEANKTINVSDLAIKTNALEVNPKYAQLKGMLLSWVQNDIALYLQHVSAALSKNDAGAAADALTDRDYVYNDFSIITQNIVTIGDTLKGVDMTEIKEWSPEKYIENTINNTE